MLENVASRSLDTVAFRMAPLSRRWRRKRERDGEIAMRRRGRGERKKEREGKKSCKNESIGGVFQEVPLEALEVGRAIGGVKLI